MRFSVVLVPAFLFLAGTGYFVGRPKGNTSLAAVESRLDTSSIPSSDRMADEYDAELVRNALQSAKLSDADSVAMVSAAGRRYMRRKIAYSTAAQAGAATPQSLDELRNEMEAARRVCDVTESFGRHTDLATLQAQIEILPSALAEHHDGRLTFTDTDLKQLERDFQATFGRPLPVSAHGESALHRAMGFDHRGRIDVAVRPDTTEGTWVRRYLTGKGVSYFAFRSAVSGKATGAHIHIGPASGKIVRGA